MNYTRQILPTAFFLAFFIVGNVHGKKKLQKNTDANKILKKITTGLGQCVKNQTSIDKEKITPHFTKCITAIENKKSLLNDKKKSAKGFLRKVFKVMTNCLKSKVTTKNTKKTNQKKKQGSKNKREKRSKRPSKAEEEMNQALAKIRKCGEVTLEEKCECGRPVVHLSDTSTNARIFKGKEAIQKQYPWQLMLQMDFDNLAGEKKRKIFGGTLISRKHVLTVAHNFYHSEDLTKYVLNSQVPT